MGAIDAGPDRPVGADGAGETPERARLRGAEQSREFGRFLQERRLRAGLTQEALAERAGLGRRSIQGLERGESLPRRESLQRLARALGLSPHEQARFTPGTPPVPRRRGEGPPRRPRLLVRQRVEPARRHNLPAELTSFVGRERELAEVKRLLAATRLLTLTGTGGCGKTRLALRVAADLVEAYADGVWLVELAPVRDADLLPRAVATALGIQEQPGQPISETLTRALRPRRLLLLLDNCEHLVETCARLADALLRGCPELQILATSREARAIGGEVSWPVPPLAVPPADSPLSLERLASFAAVQLFVERAAAAQPGLCLTEGSARAIAQICRRLDGIPLAIELAAALVQGLSPQQIAARLDQRFRLLVGGSRAALPRQQTLAATVDWSYDLLTAPERTLFNRLSVFVGGFSLEAAEQVGAGAGLDEADVVGALLRLVDRSLVVAEEGPGGDRRYRLLDTLGQYGRERLVAAGESDAVHRRHATYFLALAERADRESYGPHQQECLEWFHAEHDNVRAALGCWIAAGAADPALRLATALSRFWSLFRHLGEAHRNLGQALALADADPRVRGRALSCAAWSAGMVGERDAQRRRVEELEAVARDLADPGLLARARISRADVDYPSLPEANQEEMLRMAEASGEPALVAKALFEIGCSRLRVGDGRAARAAYQESLAIHQRLGGQIDRVATLFCLGNVAAFGGDLAAARTCCEEAVAIAQARLGRRGSADALENLGLIALLEGAHAEAGALLRESIRVRREIGEVAGLPWGFERLAGLASVTGQSARALRLAAVAANLREETGSALPAPWRPQLDGWLAAAQAALGGCDSAAVRMAWVEGQAMVLEQAVAYALEEDQT